MFVKNNNNVKIFFFEIKRNKNKLVIRLVNVSSSFVQTAFLLRSLQVSVLKQSELRSHVNVMFLEVSNNNNKH